MVISISSRWFLITLAPRLVYVWQFRRDDLAEGVLERFAGLVASGFARGLLEAFGLVVIWHRNQSPDQGGSALFG